MNLNTETLAQALKAIVQQSNDKDARIAELEAQVRRLEGVAQAASVSQQRAQELVRKLSQENHHLAMVAGKGELESYRAKVLSSEAAEVTADLQIQTAVAAGQERAERFPLQQVG